jgi:hypothetical protein
MQVCHPAHALLLLLLLLQLLSALVCLPSLSWSSATLALTTPS